MALQGRIQLLSLVALRRYIGTSSAEGELHQHAKFHLQRELTNVNLLSLQLTCGAPPSPFWNCLNTKIVDSWDRDWSAIQTEYTIPSVGRLDVALLHPGSEKSAIAASTVSIPAQYSEDDLPAASVDALSSFRSKHGVSSLSEQRLSSLNDEVRKWLKSSQRNLQFSSSLSSAERAYLHALAHNLSLLHASVGREPLRLLTLSKPKPPRADVRERARSITAIEVFVTSAISEEKRKRMQELDMKWAEVEVNPNFFKEWTKDKPLPVIRSSASFVKGLEPWRCEECERQLQSSLNFTRILSIVDIYWGKRPDSTVWRKVYSLLIPDKEKTKEKGFPPHLYVVEGGYSILRGVNTHFHVPYLVGRLPIPDTQTTSVTTYLPQLQHFVQERLKTFQVTSENLHVSLPFPGKQISEIVPEGDVILQHVQVTQPSQLYLSLGRFFGFKRA